ncbi:MAG: hypothetical protein IT440_09180 [Phycisphaeraceae bacterium]|nr:hypothetical protein [Phycisphaeraceae bacterium]
MTQDIRIGSNVCVKIVKRPTNASAVKTLVRLLSKDQKVKLENRRLGKSKVSHRRTKQRGGRVWEINAVKLRPVKGCLGETGTILATADVLTDLQSVSKFVEVSVA